MDSMRWMLLGAGLAIIVGIYLFSRLQTGLKSRRQRKKNLPESRIDPLYGDADISIDNVVDEELQKLGSALDHHHDEAAFDEPLVNDDAFEGREPATSGKVIALTVNAPAGVPFRGVVLQGALLGAGMEFGDMDIFHFTAKTGRGREPLFSAANIREPGTLIPETFADFTTDGIVLFMQVPGPGDAVQAFDEMVAVARKLADSLDATVKDSTNSVLTNQTISHLREEVISLQLHQQVTRTAS